MLTSSCEVDESKSLANAATAAATAAAESAAKLGHAEARTAEVQATMETMEGSAVAGTATAEKGVDNLPFSYPLA